MQAGPFGAIVWVVVIVVIAVSFRRQRRRGRIGAARVGPIYGMLNEDRRPSKSLWRRRPPRATRNIATQPSCSQAEAAHAVVTRMRLTHAGLDSRVL